MKIIDRYIIREFILPFLYCVVIFIFLSIITDLFGRLDEILKNEAGLPTILRYYLAFTPIVFVQVSPISVLLATLYSLGRLNRHNELIALKSAGLSLVRVIAPLIFTCIFICLTVFLANEKIVPQATLTSYLLKEEKINKDNKKKTDRLLFNLGFIGKDNRLFYISCFNASRNIMDGIEIQEQDEKNQLKRKIKASSAAWERGRWKFRGVNIYNYQDENLMGGPETITETVLDIPETPRDFLKVEKELDFLSFTELKEKIKAFSSLGDEVVRTWKVFLHYRVSFPFMSLIAMIIAIPFALTGPNVRSGGVFTSVGVCIMLSLAFIGVTQTSLVLGKQGFLPPAFSAWFSHIIFGTAGTIMIAMSRH